MAKVWERFRKALGRPWKGLGKVPQRRAWKIAPPNNYFRNRPPQKQIVIVTPNYSLSAEIKYLRVWYPRCNPSNTKRPNNGNPATKALGNSSPGHQTIGVLDPRPCLPPRPAPTRCPDEVTFRDIGSADPPSPLSFFLAHSLKQISDRRTPEGIQQLHTIMT